MLLLSEQINYNAIYACYKLVDYKIKKLNKVNIFFGLGRKNIYYFLFRFKEEKVKKYIDF